MTTTRPVPIATTLEGAISIGLQKSIDTIFIERKTIAITEEVRNFLAQKFTTATIRPNLIRPIAG